MLRACGQNGLADRVMGWWAAQSAWGLADGQSPTRVNGHLAVHEKDGIHASRPIKGRSDFEEAESVGYFKRRLFYAKVKVAVRQRLTANLNRLEARWGFFLPYRLSECRSDVFFRSIEELARRGRIRTALVIGAATGQASTEALLAGAMENENRPTVFCICNSPRRLFGRERTKAGGPVAGWYELSSSSAEERERELEELVNRIKKSNQIEFFDVVLVDGSQVEHEKDICDVVKMELRAARFVLLDDINNGWNYETHRCLLGDPQFALTDCNPTVRNGYSIFEKLDSTEIEVDSIHRPPTLVAERAN
jgi:hypothetical protein